MSAVLHRSLRTTLPTVVSGDGIYLFDATGKRYIDASGGAAVSCLGHSHPAVIRAITEQLGKVPFAHTSFFTNEPSEELAQWLVDRAPAGFGKGRVAFAGSGSEAMEIALKLARQYHVERGATTRRRFISRVGAYHGNTLGALAVGGHEARRRPYLPMLMETFQIEACHAYRNKRDDETLEEYGLRAANELESKILELGADSVAAFLAEPVGGATLGCITPAPGYFKRIREICDQYGVLLIADEVMCGMGRTGALFASADEGIAPDIITIAKGLGAGYQPIGATMAHERVVAALSEGSGQLANGHTYMSHAVACAGALAVLKSIEADGLIENVKARGAQLEQELRARFGQHANVGDIRGRGLFWAIEIVEDRASKAPFPAARNLAARIKTEARERGLICYPSGGTADLTNGDHVLLAPPFICTEADITAIVDLVEASVNAVLAS